MWKQEGHGTNQLILVAFTAWLIAWTALTRDAKRYDFFIGIPLAVFTIEFILFLSEIITEKCPAKLKQHFPHAYIKNGVCLFLLIFLLFFHPFSLISIEHITPQPGCVVPYPGIVLSKKRFIG